MKIVNFASLLAVTLIAVTGVTEAKFSPTSFVAKKTTLSDPALVEILTDKSSSQESSSSTKVATRGGGIFSVRPRLTYYAEIIWTVAVAVFMFVWLKSKSLYDDASAGGKPYVDELPNFNQLVLEKGFCIDDKLLGIGTLKLCGLADLLLVVGSYFYYQDRLEIENNKVVFMASAAYTLVHGAVHGFEIDQTGQIWDPANGLFMNLLGVGLLAAITLFTPIGIAQIFDQAGKGGGLLVGVTTWLAFVAMYVFGIKEKVYALTFINVTIYLSIFGARSLVFQKDDPKRLEFYSGNTIIATLIAATANIVVMCMEPLSCKSWFASVGGHLWFDVTLWLFMMSILK